MPTIKRRSRTKLTLSPTLSAVAFGAPAVAGAHLMDRVIAFDSWLPDRSALISRTTVEAVFAEAAAIALDLQAVLRRMRCRPALKNVRFDFTLPSYEEFLGIEARVEAELGKLPASLFTLGLPTHSLILANVAGNGAGAAVDATTDSGTRKWIAKILGALGLGEAWAAIIEILEADGIMRLLAAAIERRDWDSLKRFLRMLLDLLCSKEFLRKLAKKIGESAAARLIGQVLGKCLPIIGWVLFIGQILWAIAEQFI